MKNNLKIIVTSIALFGLNACNDDDNYIPKPSSYLNTNFPSHEYVRFDASCPYSFDISKA